ncbi:hypothetical protein BKA63DRAFT_500391 [Paraphoma chrysanthemicola]|nr:hypothetical protein BKA63DRAFT_500391 [Paraphoma chrysanthemicola]
MPVLFRSLFLMTAICIYAESYKTRLMPLEAVWQDCATQNSSFVVRIADCSVRGSQARKHFGAVTQLQLSTWVIYRCM